VSWWTAVLDTDAERLRCERASPVQSVRMVGGHQLSPSAGRMARTGPPRSPRTARSVAHGAKRRSLSRRSLRSRLASLATDHSGHAGALRTASARSGLHCARRALTRPPCSRYPALAALALATASTCAFDASGSPVSVPDVRRLPGLGDPRRTWLRRGRNGDSAGRALRASRRAVLAERVASRHGTAAVEHHDGATVTHRTQSNS